MIKDKVVFILGAGASKTIGLPLQSELLHYIFALKPKNVDSKSSFMDLKLNIEEQKLLKFYGVFNDQRIILSNFIIDNFAKDDLKAKSLVFEMKNLIEGKPTSMPRDILMDEIFKITGNVKITLEDLFTIFDKIILGREHFRTYSPENIQEIHTALRKCIIFTIAYYNTFNILNNNPVKIFANMLIKYRENTSINVDNLSIITMNWDAYLEKTIFKLCEIHNNIKTNDKIYPDLCFYDYCYDGYEKRVVSTQVKAKKHKNIKILKLHGSINWLACSYCGKVFVDYKRDIAVNRLQKECYCRLCHEEFDNCSTSPQLHSVLITPTFLKDLNNLHIKNIWHNALLELTEASRVVFIGYSFPDADFEMRCLLKKAIMPKTEIHVVLSSKDSPEYYRKALTKSGFSEQIITKLSLPGKRYSSFFGNNKIKFYYNGMKEYLQNNFQKGV